jgi:Domain of unknown function (DUF5615)
LQRASLPSVYHLSFKTVSIQSPMLSTGPDHGSSTGRSKRSRGHYRRSRIRRAPKRSPGPAPRLMRFLIDAQLPPALARWLAANGDTAEHVADRQLEAASDSSIWDCALREAATTVRMAAYTTRCRFSPRSYQPRIYFFRFPKTSRVIVIKLNRQPGKVSGVRILDYVAVIESNRIFRYIHIWSVLDLFVIEMCDEFVASLTHCFLEGLELRLVDVSEHLRFEPEFISNNVVPTMFSGIPLFSINK